MIKSLWGFLGFSDPQIDPTGHISALLAVEDQCIPLERRTFRGLPSHDVTFISKVDAQHLDLTSITSITRTPNISISPAENSKLTSNKHFNPLTVANLWLHLLLIHSFNGNFIHYDTRSQQFNSIENYNDTKFEITKLTEEQCDHLRNVAENMEQSLHSSVVDLYCLLPYTNIAGEDGLGFEVIPNTFSWASSPFPLLKRLVPPLPDRDAGWQDFVKHQRVEFVERGFYGSCPLLPATWFVLTKWVGDREGVYSVLDVETGMAFEVEEGDGVVCNIDVEGMTGLAYQTREGENGDEVWESIEPPTLKNWKIRRGSEKPVHLFLENWIRKFLSKEWVIIPHTPMIMKDSLGPMALEMRRILFDFNWPNNFPLPMDQFRDFMKRVRQVREGDWVAILNVTLFWTGFEGARRLWYGRERGFDGVGPQREVGVWDERVEMVDDEIWRIVTWERQVERAAQLAQLSGDAVDECFRREYEMEGSSVGSDEVMKRWEELRALSPATAFSEMERAHNLIQQVYTMK